MLNLLRSRMMDSDGHTLNSSTTLGASARNFIVSVRAIDDVSWPANNMLRTRSKTWSVDKVPNLVTTPNKSLYTMFTSFRFWSVLFRVSKILALDYAPTMTCKTIHLSFNQLKLYMYSSIFIKENDWNLGSHLSCETQKVWVLILLIYLLHMLR